MSFPGRGYHAVSWLAESEKPPISVGTAASRACEMLLDAGVDVSTFSPVELNKKEYFRARLVAVSL